ncbi:glucagon receptor-like [Mustelus asterias]
MTRPLRPFVVALGILALVIVPGVEEASVGRLETTLEAWQLYKKECDRKMLEEPLSQGAVCNRTFDSYACWPDAGVNSTVRVPCPWYLPWFETVQHYFVLRKCGPDGDWLRDNNSKPWRDLSSCDFDLKALQKQTDNSHILNQFRMMYSVGYSLSLIALLLACGILLAFRKLHCTRNKIHLNLFVSFILRAVSILTRDSLLWNRYNRVIEDQGDLMSLLNEQAAAACRIAHVLSQYCVLANYYWLLIEGVYLHNLLVFTVFTEKIHYLLYMSLGWGIPIVFVIPWLILKYLYENTQCWAQNHNMGFWWIIRSSILLAILVNFLIFIRIVNILVSKMRANQMCARDYKFRLAKSTLTLIPLLGVHEVLFALLTDEQAKGMVRKVKLFVELFLNSFQGLFVATLYCFLNAEVQYEVRRKWHSWQQQQTILEDWRHTWGNGRSPGSGYDAPPQAPDSLGHKGRDHSRTSEETIWERAPLGGRDSGDVAESRC